MVDHAPRFACLLSAGLLALPGCPAPGSSDTGLTTGIDSNVNTTNDASSDTGLGTSDGDTSDASSSGAPTTSPSTTSPTSADTGDASADTADAADDGSESGELQCTGDVLETLPIDSTGWIPRECTIFDIQGAWYCYDDGVSATDCVADTAPYQNPPSAMCLSGTTVGGDGAAWGGGIGLGLNDTGGAMPMKLAYDAAAHDVVGFAVEITGDTNGNELRIGFTADAAPAGASPFVAVPGVGSYDILLSDALVPANWDVPNAGETVDPSAIYDLQVQIDGNGVAGPFEFCITSLTPILTSGNDSGDPPEMPAPYGDEVCGDFATIALPGTYLLHNNVWNDAVPDGAQCIRALWDGASDVAGFVVEPAFDVGGPVPGSYPSIIYGWHYDYDNRSDYAATPVQSIGTISSHWGYDVPAAGEYNVAYDLWVHPQNDPNSPDGGLEVMIWTSFRDVTPIGTYQNSTIDLEGASWEVWYGSPGGWNTVTYRRVTNTAEVDMDLLPFLEHAVDEGYAEDDWYVLGVEAGFEIWAQYEAMTTSYYQVQVE